MDRRDLLSPRQMEIVRLAAAGLTDKEIAQRTGVTVGTLRSHWDRMRARLGAPSRAAIVARAGEDERETLLAELDLLHDALNESRLLVWTARTDGFVDYVSASFQRFSGLPQSAILGPGCRTLMPDSQIEASGERWRKAVERRRGYEAEVLFRDALGDFIPYVIRLEPIKSPEGTVARWRGLAWRAIDERATVPEEPTPDLVSPLSGEPSWATACGPAYDPELWMLVREADGAAFVASRRWLRAVAVSPLSPTYRAQALATVRDYAGRGETLAFVGRADESLFEADGPTVATVCWLVEG